MIASLFLFATLLALAACKHSSESGRFSFSKEVTSDFSDSSSSSSSSSVSTSTRRELVRAQRDQRRVELAVQAALLQDRQEPAFPVARKLKSKAYQACLTTSRDVLPDDGVSPGTADPVFGPAAVLTFTSPADGLFGPARTRALVENLDQQTSFGTLFNEVRKSGFLGEIELRTLVQSDSTFSLTSRALITPCFPVTDEPGLTVELVALAQNSVGQLRAKWLAIENFFDDDGDFVDNFSEELRFSVYDGVVGKFDVSQDGVANVLVSACDQFSYFQ